MCLNYYIRRSDRDRFNATLFHKKCDNKGATIWNLDSKNSRFNIGGTNPLD
jgi:hypothetical protein